VCRIEFRHMPHEKAAQTRQLFRGATWLLKIRQLPNHHARQFQGRHGGQARSGTAAPGLLERASPQVRHGK